MTEDEVWALLELDPKKALKRDVKKSYARLLKSIDQNDNPQAFIELRTAYETALYQIDMQESVPDMPVAPIERATSKDDEQVATKLETEIFDPLKIAFELLSATNPTEELTQWRNLFDSPELEEIDNYIQFERELITHILLWRGYFKDARSESGEQIEPQIPPLNTAIAKIIFEHFGWDRESNSTVLANQHAFNWLESDSNRDPDVSIRGTYSISQRRIEKQSTNPSNIWLTCLMIFFGLTIIGGAFDNQANPQAAKLYQEILESNPDPFLLRDSLSLEQRIEISCAGRISSFCDQVKVDPTPLMILQPNANPSFLSDADPLLVQEQKRVNLLDLRRRINAHRKLDQEKLEQLFPDVSNKENLEFQLQNMFEPTSPNPAEISAVPDSEIEDRNKDNDP